MHLLEDLLDEIQQSALNCLVALAFSDAKRVSVNPANGADNHQSRTQDDEFFKGIKTDQDGSDIDG